MLRIDDKDPTPMQMREQRMSYRPIHKRLRIFFVSGGKREAVWRWRGILFDHNKRRKPVKS